MGRPLTGIRPPRKYSRAEIEGLTVNELQDLVEASQHLLELALEGPGDDRAPVFMIKSLFYKMKCAGIVWTRQASKGITESEAIVISCLAKGHATKQQIYVALYGARIAADDYPNTGALDVIMVRARAALGSLGFEVETVYGGGYRFPKAQTFKAMVQSGEYSSTQQEM